MKLRAFLLFVAGHHPIHPSSARPGDNDDMIEAFRPLLEQYGVQAFRLFSPGVPVAAK